MLDFLNILYVFQQLGNRTLARAKAEPWMANLERLRQDVVDLIRIFRKSYIRNSTKIYDYSSAIFRKALH